MKDKILTMTEGEAFSKLYAFEKVVAHLEANKNDLRRKERARIRIAQGIINLFVSLGEQEYAGESFQFAPERVREPIQSED